MKALFMSFSVEFGDLCHENPLTYAQVEKLLVWNITDIEIPSDKLSAITQKPRPHNINTKSIIKGRRRQHCHFSLELY